MSLAYFIRDRFYSHSIDFPDEVTPFSAVRVAPPTLEAEKWIWEGEDIGWREATQEEIISMLRPRLKKIVDNRRDGKIALGVQYQFPDGPGVVQTKTEADIRNIMGVALTATILTGQGVSDPVIPFRDMADVTHMLTPTQTIQMGMTAQAYLSWVYSQSWDIKNQLDSATTVAELKAVNLEF